MRLFPYDCYLLHDWEDFATIIKRSLEQLDTADQYLYSVDIVMIRLWREFSGKIPIVGEMIPAEAVGYLTGCPGWVECLYHQCYPQYPSPPPRVSALLSSSTLTGWEVLAEVLDGVSGSHEPSRRLRLCAAVYFQERKHPGDIHPRRIECLQRISSCAISMRIRESCRSVPVLASR